MTRIPSSTNRTGSSDTARFNQPRNDVFISYSRRDQDFVKRLAATFEQQGRDPWVDWDDIQKGEEWWKAIQRGIESANTFVFVISPDSVASVVCRKEIEYAAQNHKRFLPIVWREGFDERQLHPAISSHNWLFFRESDRFEDAFQDLLKAIDTDLDHVRDHTRLLVRAIEWQNKDQHPSYLLRGIDLNEAEQWLAKSPGKDPHPTALQVHYITTSLDAELAKRQARQKARWIVVITTILINMVLVTLGYFTFYGFATRWTQERVEENLINSLKVGLIGIDGDEFEALAQLNSTPNNPPVDNPLYQEHQTWLRQVHEVFPNAFPRSYIEGRGPDELLWIGDVTRELGVASETQFRTAYTPVNPATNVYDQSSPAESLSPDSSSRDSVILESARPPVPSIQITDEVYSDRLGSWISASGPIWNSNQQVVGGLRVDFRADYVLQVQREVRNKLIIAYVVIFAWFFILSLIILRVTQPTDGQVRSEKRSS